MSRRHAEEEGERMGSLDAAGQDEGHGDDGDESEDEDGGVRLPFYMQPSTAVTKPKGNTPETTTRELGMQKAKEREMVRRAARRGVAFGFETGEGRRRSVEAVQGGRLVESSFAKGEWGVKWRE